MLEYQKDRQELIKDLLNERKKIGTTQVNMLLDSYKKKDIILHLLEQLGIDPELEGAQYMIDIVEDVYLEIKSQFELKTIKEKLQNKNSVIYKELALNYFNEVNETTINAINTEINNAFRKRNTTIKSSDVVVSDKKDIIIGGRKTLSIVTFIYLLSKYLYDNKMLEKERVFKL